MNGTNRKLLVIAPHADDAEFGIGGLLTRVSRAAEIRVAIMAKGGYRRSDGQTIAFATRKDEARSALGLLGVTDVSFSLAFDENRALEEPYADVVGAIAREIGGFQPDTVFVNLPSFNQDHRRVFDAFVTATRPGHLGSIQHVYAYEYPGNSWGPSTPDWGKVYVPLGSGDMWAKIVALKHHKSQFAVLGGVCPQAAQALATQRGAECGEAYAELVYLMRGTL